jgi:hypothetical protein
LEYVERFKTTLSTLKSPKKCQNCETKTKTATAHTQISRTLEDLKNTDGLPVGCDCFRYGVRIFRNSGCIPENPTAKLAAMAGSKGGPAQVGNSAGRGGDNSSVDAEFARRIGLDFHTEDVDLVSFCEMQYSIMGGCELF